MKMIKVTVEILDEDFNRIAGASAVRETATDFGTDVHETILRDRALLGTFLKMMTYGLHLGLSKKNNLIT